MGIKNVKKCHNIIILTIGRLDVIGIGAENNKASQIKIIDSLERSSWLISLDLVVSRQHFIVMSAPSNFIAAVNAQYINLKHCQI